MANTTSAIIFPTCGPIIWTPITLSVFSSTNIFTNPSVSLFTFALELAKNGNFPILYAILSFLICSSVFPTDAISGEHDVSYKQDEGVTYNARDMAITRASIENIPIHLITSIPSIETYKNIIDKKYFCTYLTERYKKASLPNFEIVNLKNKNLPKNTWIAKETLNKVKVHLNKGDQVLFFLNRRGYAPFVICKKCNYKFQCPNCSVNLNFHKREKKLICHYCGFKTFLHRICIDKNKCEFLMCGPGVERIYKELKKIFPEKKIEIFSSDTLIKKKKRQDIIDKIENKKIDILVGTQLISKGFHFSNLNCIVVVDADFSSHGYDLRSAEKNVQLYYQLSGRAGREASESAIYFQTYDPDDSVLLEVSKNNPYDFLNSEINLRKKNKLPPFYRLISLIVSGQNEQIVSKYGLIIKKQIPKFNNVEIMGPVNAPIFKLKRNFRSRILIRSPKNFFIQKHLASFIKKLQLSKGIKLTVDVDPINFS